MDATQSGRPALSNAVYLAEAAAEVSNSSATIV
jgi:hypothetical protein